MFLIENPVYVQMTTAVFFFQKLTQADIHSISYTLSRNQTVVVQYAHDEDSDMFQVQILIELELKPANLSCLDWSII